LAKIVQGLGDSEKRTRILFVTLDPGRDSPQVLHRYISAFASGHAVGLTGNETGIENLTKRYRAAYRPRQTDTDELSHSAAVYVFDPQGHARFLVTPDDSIVTVVGDLRRLLDSSR
jgi:protein SCO1/2